MNLRVNIQCRLGDFVLRTRFRSDVRIAGLFGPSGAGKTSLINALAGLMTPTQGEIRLGESVLFDAQQGINLPPEKRPVGVVFQEGRLFPHLNVLQNLQFAYRLTPVARRRFPLARVVDELQLKPLLKQKVTSLSGGQRQRVALGRSLVTCPQLLLLDEPLSALDEASKQQILPLLRHVQRVFAIDMLVVSHSLRDLLLLTDYLILLEQGEIFKEGPVRELMRDERFLTWGGGPGIPNVFDLRVSQHDLRGGITHYVPLHETKKTGTLKGTLRADLPVGTSVRAVLPPDEIALAWAPVEYVSMQNQHRGVIKDLLYSHHGVYCCVDVGFDLWSRLTPNAVKQLALLPGKKVWCLFKTFAFDFVVTGAPLAGLEVSAYHDKTTRPSTCPL